MQYSDIFQNNTPWRVALIFLFGLQSGINTRLKVDPGYHFVHGVFTHQWQNRLFVGHDYPHAGYLSKIHLRTFDPVRRVDPEPL